MATLISFICIKSVIMDRTRQQTFTMGKIYLFDSDFDTVNDQNEHHSWSSPKEMKEYFVKESEYIQNYPYSIVPLIL